MEQVKIPNDVGHFEIVDGIIFHYENGKVYCIQVDKPIDMKNSFVGEFGASVYIEEK
jgi:hypothetical protein